MTNGQTTFILGSHLESVAAGAKRYILAEILDVTQAVTSELGRLTDFTGATAVAAGASGFVPAPSVGDADKFLRGDGTWADAGQIVIGTTPSTVEGAFWLEDES